MAGGWIPCNCSNKRDTRQLVLNLSHLLMTFSKNDMPLDLF